MPSSVILCGGSDARSMPEKCDDAGGQLHQAGNGTQGRAFAGAVGAEQPDRLAFADIDGDAADRGNAAVGCADACKLDHGAASGRDVRVARTEIGADHFRIFDDFLRVAFGDLLPVVEHNDVFRHRHDGAHQVLDDDDGEPAARQFTDQARRPDRPPPD